MASARSRRVPERLGAFAAEQEVEDALKLDEVDQLYLAGGEHHACKAQRRSRPHRSYINADAISALLVGAPALVDLLLEEDSVRSVTLVARDLINLSLAAGGVDLDPVWEALAQRIRAKAAAEAAGAAAAAAAAPELAAPASVAMAGEPQPTEATSSRPAMQPPRNRSRRGRALAQPRQPTALEVVRAALASDPARTNLLKKNDAMCQYQLHPKNLQGVETSRGKHGAVYCRELDIRAAAHRKHGDEACLEASKRAIVQREEQRQQDREKREAEALQERREMVAVRLADAQVPADAPEVKGNWNLDSAVRWGYFSLPRLLEEAIQKYQTRTAKEKRQSMLDERLEAEGLTFFDRDWRYRAFISSGLVEEVEAVLVVARRRKEEQREALERMLELEDRLDAAGLSIVYSAESFMFYEWVSTGEGDIAAVVEGLVAQLKRQTEILRLLEQNRILYRRDSRCVRDFISGGTQGSSAQVVVSKLLISLQQEHERSLELLKRLSEECLPPNLSHSGAREYVSSGGSLEAAVKAIKASYLGRTGWSISRGW